MSDVEQHDEATAAEPIDTTAALVEWVAGFVGRIESTPTTDLVWCPQWWEHTEVVDRLVTLHAAYLDAVDEHTLSNWWLVHWGGHQRAFEAVMRRCKREHVASSTLIAPTPPPDWTAAP